MFVLPLPYVLQMVWCKGQYPTYTGDWFADEQTGQGEMVYRNGARTFFQSPTHATSLVLSSAHAQVNNHHGLYNECLLSHLRTRCRLLL